jgi:hypothetical protein
MFPHMMFLRKYIFWWKFCCLRFKQGKTKKQPKKKKKLLVNRKKDLSRIFFQIMFLGSSFNELIANNTFAKYNKTYKRLGSKWTK